MATLYDLAQAYLNRGLPDISGIYGNNTNNTLAPIDFGGEEPVSPQGLTPEQLALLYSQYNNVGGDGGENDNNNDFTDGRATNNAGINSFSDLSGITGIGTLGNLASYALGGIPGVISSNLMGAGFTGLNNTFGFTQAARDQKARDDAAARGAAKANMAEARAITDRISTGFTARGPNEQDYGGGIGSSRGGGASPGSAGPGGSDTEGSS